MKLLILGNAALWTWTSDKTCCVGGAQNAEALFRQTQSGAQQASREAYQQHGGAFPSSDIPQDPVTAVPAATLAPERFQGRILTFVSAGGKGELSSSVQAGSFFAAGMLVHSRLQARARCMPSDHCVCNHSVFAAASSASGLIRVALSCIVTWHLVSTLCTPQEMRSHSLHLLPVSQRQHIPTHSMHQAPQQPRPTPCKMCNGSCKRQLKL